MAFGRSELPFLLKEGIVEIGTWTSPELIGTVGNGDPATSFSGDDIGYFAQGSSNYLIPREYAQFDAGTPRIKVRKDLIAKDLMLELGLAQFNKDTLELGKGAYVQPGFSDGGFTGDLIWLGHDEPVPVRKGYHVTTALTDGTPFHIAIWSAEVKSDDAGQTLSGTEHATQAITIEAFPHPNFGTLGNDPFKDLGLMWLDNS